LKIRSYRYYDTQTNGIDFQGMLDSLQQIPQGDVVLLHGCCHNPTGADISPAQWDSVIEILKQRQLTPFIDVAYLGFADGISEDAYGIRKAVELLPEVLIANSFSKNFGLYRERTGAVVVITESAKQSHAAKTHIMSAARRSYSMSPYHGAGIVAHLLSDDQLTQEWKTELTEVRNNMNRNRMMLAEGLNKAQSRINFDFLARSRGMFCFLGINKEQVLQLRQQYGIYLLDNTRINVAGLSEHNIPTVVKRVAETLNR